MGRIWYEKSIHAHLYNIPRMNWWLHQFSKRSYNDQKHSRRAAVCKRTIKYSHWVLKITQDFSGNSPKVAGKLSARRAMLRDVITLCSLRQIYLDNHGWYCLSTVSFPLLSWSGGNISGFRPVVVIAISRGSSSRCADGFPMLFNLTVQLHPTNRLERRESMARRRTDRGACDATDVCRCEPNRI